MLVLTRKPQEKICIGNDIVITVLRTKGKAVRIGIEAPHDMRVLRGEIAFDATKRVEPAVDVDVVAEAEVERRILHARLPRAKATIAIPQLAAGTEPLAAMLSPVVSS